MATQSPFFLLEDIFRNFDTKVQPPAWIVDEVQRRIVLLLNHVLMQEKEAMSRLARQKSRVIQFHWRSITLKLVATPAGLLDRAESAATPDLTLSLTDTSPLAIANSLLRGDKPAVRIEGDVQLAAEVNWLADHVRWDVEEDLARIVGDAPAHALGDATRHTLKALREFIGARKPATPAGPAA